MRTYWLALRRSAGLAPYSNDTERVIYICHLTMFRSLARKRISYTRNFAGGNARTLAELELNVMLLNLSL